MRYNDLQLKFGGEFDELEEEGEGLSAAQAKAISEAARAAFVGLKVGEKPAWFDEYLHLVELGWPWRVACYMAWAASARIGRWPDTLEELATQILGLKTTRSVYAWRQKYPTINQVVAMLQAAPMWEHRREVIEALVTVARQPDYKGFNDRKLFLEMTGDYVPRSVQKVMGMGGAKDLSDLTDEELDALLADDGTRGAQEGTGPGATGEEGQDVE